MLSPGVAARLAAGGERIVITGAGGWLGLATLELLHQALGPAFAHRVVCFGSSERLLQLRDGTTVRQQPLAHIGALAPAPSWVLHLAFLTKDRAEAMSEGAYRAANRTISETVRGALDTIGATAVFVASSGAAAKAEDPAASPAMRLYGALKREDEELMARWAEEADKCAVIGRIFNISGPYINKHQAYALASFILDAQAGRPVSVKAPHPVIRSYVAIRELMSLVFALMSSEPGSVARFDSGGEPMELAEAAEVIAETLGAPQVMRAPITVREPDRYVGDGEHYAGLLAQYRVEPVSFPEQVSETAEFLASLR